MAARTPSSNSKEGENSPAVLAYRVKKLEETQTEGFKVVNEKLDKLVYSFATKSELQLLEKQATAEHESINTKINETRIGLEEDIKYVQSDVEILTKKRWVQNTLSAILGAVITLLVTYAIADFLRK